MKPKFKKIGKRYLPLGRLKGKQLNTAIRTWLEGSIIPFLYYLESELRRELKIPHTHSCFALDCSDGTYVFESSVQNLVSMLDHRGDWPRAEPLMCSLLIECTPGFDDVFWWASVDFGIEEVQDETHGPYWMTYVDCYHFSIEEQLPLRKAQDIVEQLLLSLRIQTMASTS